MKQLQLQSALTGQCSQMTYVTAVLSLGANSELVTELRVVLVDAALDRRASNATSDLIKEASAAKAKDEADQAKGRKVPPL